MKQFSSSVGKFTKILRSICGKLTLERKINFYQKCISMKASKVETYIACFRRTEKVDFLSFKEIHTKRKLDLPIE